MRIGITLNDTVRDFTETVDEIYGSYLTTIDSLSTLDVNDMSETPLESKGDAILTKVVNTVERVHLNLPPVDDLFGITSRYTFEDVEEYEGFLYEESAFQIFGRTNLMYLEAMSDLNSLYSLMVSDGHLVSVVSQERKNSKQATLMFLAQNLCSTNNFKFLYNYSKIWELYDLVITANPYIIASKPEGKLCFKIETKYNSELDADGTFTDMHDVQQFYKQERNG